MMTSKAGYYTTEDVASDLGFSPRSITNWLKAWHESGGTEGIPGGFKVGKCWRIDRSAYKAWLDEQKQRPVLDV